MILLTIISAIVSGLAVVGNFIMQAIQTLNSIPWKKILVWGLVIGFIGYFGAVTYSLLKVSLTAMQMVFSSSSIGTGSPGDYSTATFTFSSLWTNLAGVIPAFHRFMLRFFGFDWIIWLGANALHFYIINFLLSKFAPPISRAVRFVAESL